MERRYNIGSASITVRSGSSVSYSGVGSQTARASGAGGGPASGAPRTTHAPALAPHLQTVLNQ